VSRVITVMGTPIVSGCLLSLCVHVSDDILGLLGLPVRKLVVPFSASAQ
jgi:hypothetical protein